MNPKGTEGWRYRYRFDGKARMISFGPYPEVSLRAARDMCRAARDILHAGKDPSREKQILKQEEKSQGLSFKDVAEEWVEKKSQKWTDRTIERNTVLLTRYLYPEIGVTPICEIEPPVLLAALRKMEALGIHESAKRAPACRLNPRVRRCLQLLYAQLRDRPQRGGNPPPAKKWL